MKLPVSACTIIIVCLLLFVIIVIVYYYCLLLLFIIVVVYYYCYYCFCKVKLFDDFTADGTLCNILAIAYKVKVEHSW